MRKKGIHILIVDDSNTNVVLLEVFLKSAGYSIGTAFNALEALNLINKRKPSLILLDLNMPGISGHEFLSKIKTNKTTSDIPVIVVSAYSDDENIIKSFNLGAIDFIKKPVNLTNLLKVVVDTLSM